MEIDLKQISDLIAVITGTDITEITVESGDQKITVKKAANVTPATQVVVADAAQATPGTAPPQASPTLSFEPHMEHQPPKASDSTTNNQDWVPVTAPMVGTFYRGTSPTSKPFVDVGDRISVGQTVCIIEAMKLMNDMPSEVSGRIVKICVDNGSTVEYGQQLFLVDPKG